MRTTLSVRPGPAYNVKSLRNLKGGEQFKEVRFEILIREKTADVITGNTLKSRRISAETIPLVKSSADRTPWQTLKLSSTQICMILPIG